MKQTQPLNTEPTSVLPTACVHKGHTNYKYIKFVIEGG